MATTAKPPLNPYTAADLQAAQAIVDNGHQVIALIDACHACTMDFTDARAQTLSLMQMAQGILDRFGAGVDRNA